MKINNSKRGYLRLYASLVCTVLVLILSGMPALAEESKTGGAVSPFDSLKKTYAGINSLEASFHQKIFVSGIKKMRDAEGDFFFKRHKGFIWKYTKPKGKLFLYDGRYMWQEEEDKPFVLKNKVSAEKTGGTFFDLIEDIAHIDNLFTVKQQSMVAGMQYFELVPKKDSSVNMAKLWIDKNNLLRKIEILEFTGNINTIEFTDIKVNPPINDAKFIYKPDGKKDIVER
jgi:outer membrane lipoprotein carrier protein